NPARPPSFTRSRGDCPICLSASAGNPEATQGRTASAGRLRLRNGSEAGGGVGGLGDGEAEVLVGIDGGVVDADFVVEVGAWGAAAEAEVADDVAALHALAGGDGGGGQMSEAGRDAVAVVHDHHAPVAAEHVREDYGAVGRGQHGTAIGGGDVHAGVE